MRSIRFTAKGMAAILSLSAVLNSAAPFAATDELEMDMEYRLEETAVQELPAEQEEVDVYESEYEPDEYVAGVQDDDVFPDAYDKGLLIAASADDDWLIDTEDEGIFDVILDNDNDEELFEEETEDNDGELLEEETEDEEMIVEDGLDDEVAAFYAIIVNAGEISVKIERLNGEAFPEGASAKIESVSVENPYMLIDAAMAEAEDVYDEIGPDFIESDEPVQDENVFSDNKSLIQDEDVFSDNKPLIQDEDTFSDNEPLIIDQEAITPAGMDGNGMVLPFRISVTNEDGDAVESGLRYEINAGIAVNSDEKEHAVLMENNGREWVVASEASEDGIAGFSSENCVFALVKYAEKEAEGVRFTRVWRDYGKEAQRPESVTYFLYDAEDLDTPLASAALSAEDAGDDYHWNGVFEDVPATYADGREIRYIVKPATGMQDPNAYDIAFIHDALANENGRVAFHMASAVDETEDGRVMIGEMAVFAGSTDKIVNINNNPDFKDEDAVNIGGIDKTIWDIASISFPK